MRRALPEALAIHHDAVLVDVVASEQGLHRGVDVDLRAREGGFASDARSRVVENEHVEARAGIQARLAKWVLCFPRYRAAAGPCQGRAFRRENQPYSSEPSRVLKSLLGSVSPRLSGVPTW